MATTPYADLRYPVGTDATTIATYFQNLATDVDQKVIVRVASNTERNGLDTYDGMLVYVTGTKRTFRYDATASRWDYVSGPWYTWTPDVVAVAGGAVVTATTYTRRGLYIIKDALIHFQANLRFQGGINGQAGDLRLQMPTGVVAKTTEPEQHGIVSELYTPAVLRTWKGGGFVLVGGQQVGLLFPMSAGDCSMGPFRNATGAGATGTGTPLISGSYPLTDGARLSVFGAYELSSWPAL